MSYFLFFYIFVSDQTFFFVCVATRTEWDMHRLPTVTFEHFYLSVSVWHSMEVTHILIFATLIDRLLFLVISRSPPDLQKLAVKTLPLSNLFQANSTFTFITRGCHSYHKVSCCTKIFVSVLLWCCDHKAV